MAYILDPVVEELSQRLLDHVEDGAKWLVVDFNDNKLIKLPGISETQSWIEGALQMDQLNLPNDGYAGVVINLQLAWLDYNDVFSFIAKILRPGGKLVFSTLGPDTLFELGYAWNQVDTETHIHPFVDLHHLGDKLVQCGFVKPILDSDWVGVQYDDVDLLMDDLRGEGFQNINATRRKTLTGKNRMQRLRDQFDQSPVNITFELIYGYAEFPGKKATDDQTTSVKVDLPTPR